MISIFQIIITKVILPMGDCSSQCLVVSRFLVLLRPFCSFEGGELDRANAWLACLKYQPASLTSGSAKGFLWMQLPIVDRNQHST